jgi:hypothetical protein
MARPSGEAGLIKLKTEQAIEAARKAILRHEPITILGEEFLITALEFDYVPYSIYAGDERSPSAKIEVEQLIPINQETPASPDTDTAPHSPDARP